MNTVLFMLTGIVLGNSISEAFDHGEDGIAIRLLVVTVLVFAAYLVTALKSAD